MFDVRNILPTGIPPGSGSWMQGKAPDIISRALPKFLTPEMYIGLSTQIIYAPAGEPTSGIGGATDFSSAFDAMRAEMLSLQLSSEWPPTSGSTADKLAPYGIALQPGHRYRITSGIDFTKFANRGMQLFGFGAFIIPDMAGGVALDLIGSHGWTINGLNIWTDSGNSFGTGRPDFLAMIGRYSTLSPADNMRFVDCFLYGWANKAIFANFGAEVSGFRGGHLESYFTDAPAYWLDSRNSLDLGLYTKCTGVTLAAGNEYSCIQHTIEQTSIRNIGMNAKGALHIESALGESQLNRVHALHVKNVYLTNNGTDTNNHPGITVHGKITDFKYSAHAELWQANATIQLSHLILIDTTDAAVTQESWTIEELLSDAEIATIDKTNDANAVTMLNWDLRVDRNRGTDQSGTTAKLFGSHLSGSTFCGTLRTSENDATLINLDALGGFFGDVIANQVFVNLAIPSDKTKVAGRFITPTEMRYFPQGAYDPTFTTVANLDATPTGTDFRYWRIGKRVFVRGSVTIDPTTVTTATSFRISLPIVSNLAASNDLIGVGGSNIGAHGMGIVADTVNDEALAALVSGSTASHSYRVTFDYEIL